MGERKQEALYGPIIIMPISYLTRKTALRLTKKGRWLEASAAWRRLLASNAARPSDYVRFARAVEVNEGDEPAAEAFDGAARRFPIDANVQRQLGLYLLRRRQDAQAALAFARGRVLAPEDPVLGRDLAGLSIGAQHQRMLAVRAYKDASSPSPQVETGFERLSARGALHKARLADKAGDWATSARLYRTVLEHRPAYAHGYLKLGHALKEMQDLVGAEAAYWRAVALTGAKADAFLHLGHVLKLNGDQPASMAAYLAAQAIEPGHPEVGVELENQGHTPLELEQLAKQLLTNPISLGGEAWDGRGPEGEGSLPYPLEVRLKEEAVRADLARMLSVGTC